MLLVCTSHWIHAQEVVAPLRFNPVLQHTTIQQFNTHKTRAVLPFIDDFSYDGPYPNPNLWEDSLAYINNTMGSFPITRGVATLDGLNAKGRPYYPYQYSSGLADSLTSKPIDLSSYTAANNIYFSFFYQAQGLGFAPEMNDSLFLYFKNNNNDWVRVWQTRGTGLQVFKIQLLPITDAQYLHAGFQFRFVNIASLNLNDDVWNLDYIKIDVNRNLADSIMNDVAFTTEPTSILSPYSSMPYRHFIANQANEKSLTQDFTIRNLYPIAESVTTMHTATELISSTSISNASLPSTAIVAKSSINQSIPTYNIAYTAPTNKSKIVIRNTYFYAPVNGTDRRQNDTLVRDAVFDNYFAYDDGSAEKSYFLLPAFNYPSKTALSFTLNEADTIRGLMIHFGAQVPTAAGKYFSIVLYKSLSGGIGSTDSIIQQEDLLQVQYDNTINGFSTYALLNPVFLQAGTYYMGITQPANFGSDSLYYGLDVNTNTNSQHLYYNVDGTWLASITAGSVMMRPIVGQSFTPTATNDITATTNNATLQVYPNPVANSLWIKSKNTIVECSLFATSGAFIKKYIPTENKINLENIPSGLYILRSTDLHGNTYYNKIYKQ